MADNYSDRVQRLFQRVGNLQSAVDVEKNNRLKEIEGVLGELERKVADMRDSKSEKIGYFDKIIKEIHASLAEES